MAVTGNTRWAAAFGAGMLGFYVQDNFNATDRLDLTFGLRADIPLFFDVPAENAPFNDFMVSRGWDYKTNSKLNSRPLFSPRLGFRWNIGQTQKYVLRGGTGIFTGRIPYVWLSNNFSNTGVQLSVYRVANRTVRMLPKICLLSSTPPSKDRMSGSSLPAVRRQSMYLTKISNTLRISGQTWHWIFLLAEYAGRPKRFIPRH